MNSPSCPRSNLQFLPTWGQLALHYYPWLVTISHLLTHSKDGMPTQTFPNELEIIFCLKNALNRIKLLQLIRANSTRS